MLHTISSPSQIIRLIPQPQTDFYHRKPPFTPVAAASSHHYTPPTARCQKSFSAFFATEFAENTEALFLNSTTHIKLSKNVRVLKLKNEDLRLKIYGIARGETV
jgi:hypothetical protein